MARPIQYCKGKKKEKKDVIKINLKKNSEN